MATHPLLTRRRLLGFGAGAVASTIAGCSGGDGPLETPTDSRTPFLREIAFEGTDLVVQLAEDHGISHFNLIAPDGSIFGQTDVPVGATTARIEILDIKPEGAGFKHYTPGVHELVAVSEAGSTSTTVNLEPDLRIVDVRQYLEGTRASDYGKLVVEVENVGTGPTWVYDVTNRNAPNRAANVDLGSDHGVLLLEFDGPSEQAIVPPEESRDFSDVVFPIVFSNDDTSNCDGQIEMSVIVGSAVLDPIERDIQLIIEGDTLSAGLDGGYTCSEVAVELINKQTANE